MEISVPVYLTMILVSDFVPFFTQIASMWLAAKHQMEDLATDKLGREPDDDTSTEVGSHVLSGLRQELEG